MYHTIDVHVELFQLLDVGKCDFISYEHIDEVFSVFFAEFPPAHALLAQLTGSASAKEADFLDFYIFCAEHQTLSCYQGFDAVHSVLTTANGGGKAVITVEQLYARFERLGLECSYKELEELIAAFFGPGYGVLHVSDVLQLLRAFAHVD